MKQTCILQQQLQEELQSLSFHAFEHCIEKLLTAMGYRSVDLLSRTHLRQFTRHGGLDMQAHSRLGVTDTSVILQLKQYTRPVSRRFVDELRGTMLRLGAGQGLIITTSTFSKVARRVAAENRLVPVRLIDGEELIELLCQHAIGTAKTGKNKWRLDRQFFKKLRKRYPKSTSQSAKASSFQKGARQSIAPSNPSPTNNPRNPMLWRTHVLAGIGSLWLLQSLPGVITKENLPLLISLSALGALLPDLDAVESKVKHLEVGGVQPFAPLSTLMHQAFGHRGRLHSLLGLGVVTAISVPLGFWLGWQAPLALCLGYASHLLLDACTRTGIPLIRPQERFYLLPKRLRFITGSLAEDALLPLLAIAVVVLLLTRLLSA